LCYIDPPFNSNKKYFQIYNNIRGRGKQDKAQAQAFVDTWDWDSAAEKGFSQITTNFEGRFTRQAIELIRGLETILSKSDLLAYLVSMTLRITEIFRVLKPTGSFYLHCDTTASHYLKLILDAIFCGQGGDFTNEIIWSYKRYTATSNRFQRLHDTIFYYSKSDETKFNIIRDEYGEKSGKADSHYKQDEDGKWFRWQKRAGKEPYKIFLSLEGRRVGDVWDIPIINASAKERMGYPTQKPEALLERVIEASSNEGDLVLDAYCGCGTTVAVAERLKRNWIGIDITYHSIGLILKRMADAFGEGILDTITVDGIPRDMRAARALANKADDYVRKEFEKWAALTYSNNRAVINEKKGADKGIDGMVYFAIGPGKTERMVIQVKSGHVNRGTIAKLRGDMEREKAEMSVLITLDEPSKPMLEEAISSGYYHHELMGRDYPRVKIVTIREMIENNVRMDLPLSFDSVKSGKKADKDGEQLPIGL